MVQTICPRALEQWFSLKQRSQPQAQGQENLAS